MKSTFIRKLTIVILYHVIFLLAFQAGGWPLFGKIAQAQVSDVSHHDHPPILQASHSPDLTDHQHHEAHSLNNHEGPLYAELTTETGLPSFLPWWVIIIPLLGALTLFGLQNTYLQGLMVIFSCAITLVVSLLMYPLVIYGQRMGDSLRKGIFYSLSFLPSFNLNITFKVDPAALTLVIFTALIWLLVAIFSHDYLSIENHRLRYNVANLGCLSSTLGAFLAGDLFTLYIFYECILLFLYLMVIHREDETALQSAKIYLYFGVFTGLLLLFGIFLFSHIAGSLEIRSAALALSKIDPALKYFIAALFLLGFGGKAGVFLEHIWMPSSYGSAPCLTAALSSGIMIEVGAYGIFRTVNMIFTPLGGLENSAAWLTTYRLGYILIWLGIITMFLGALNALFSTQALRLLAYSSVSQMGYIIMGIGCAAYMGQDGAMGLAGSLYHIINHAIFKAGLFLSIGAVYFSTRELEIKNLGGLWKKLPMAAVTFLICALAIAGFPCFNGFASKTMLHHAILEAYHHSVHLTGSHTPDSWLRLAEMIFIITAGCTFAYNMKLFGLTFLGPQKQENEKIASIPFFMQASLLFFSIGVFFFGLFPNWLLEHFLGPMLPYFGFHPQSHAYHLIYNLHSSSQHSILPLLYDPVKRTLLSSAEVLHNLSGGSTAILLGGLILLLGLGLGLFEFEISPRYSLSRLYQKVFQLFRSLCRITYQIIVKRAESFISLFMVHLWIAKIKLDLIVQESPSILMDDSSFPHFLGGSELTKHPLGVDNSLFHTISQAEQGYSGAVDRVFQNQKGVFDHISTADRKIDQAVIKVRNVKGIFGRISSVEEKMSVPLDCAVEVKKYSFFSRLTRADYQLDGAFEKVIFSRFFWGAFAKAGGLKDSLWKSFSLFEELYDKKVERLLFGLIGSEDLSKITLGTSDFSNSWFLRMCKKASEIHSGDISNYISWIALSLTAIIAILIGFLYIQSFSAMIVAMTILIVFFSLLTLLLKR